MISQFSVSVSKHWFVCYEEYDCVCEIKKIYILIYLKCNIFLSLSLFTMCAVHFEETAVAVWSQVEI